jgi:hypothetical protein
MQPNHLSEFKENVIGFIKNVVDSSNFNNIEQIQKLLKQFKLFGKMIVQEFTTGFKVK